MKVLDIIKVFLYSLPFVVVLVVGIFVYEKGLLSFKSDEKKSELVKTARLITNGDILVQDILYRSPSKADGTYDFEAYFKYVKDRISSADLAIANFDGTISDRVSSSIYPSFNSPKELAQSLKNTGYDMVNLANGHILNNGLDAAIDTIDTFANSGIDTVGFYKEDSIKEGIVIKEVNGIKIATIAYTYSIGDFDAALTPEERNKHLSNLNEEKIKADIERAEREADVIIVMPQYPVEYSLEPSEKQKDLYRKMIDWGADLVFGGHSNIIEESETITKDGDRKFIIYSMGNFISNQTMDLSGNKWTERGLLMDVTFEKTGDKTIVKTVQAHPTLVWAKQKDTIGADGYPYLDYRVIVLEDFIEGGKYRKELDAEMQTKVDTAYKESKELINIQW
ncbi:MULTISPECIES: CapA family protein [unclassified Gemella]|uniref:CapA family protein n=1 Tax=unclassified Gemella TaxID=2624949 RepID=UPI0015D020DC|nr:CapA family protein [Gemella sp. GL1.1]NYS27993.1 CapA family protein [Gemella sp. GL1]